MKKIIFIGLLIFLNLNFSYAAFDITPGARPSGLGGAFTALADDLNSVLYNPAGLIFNRKINILVSYNQHYVGIGQGISSSYLSAAYTINKFGFGLSAYLNNFSIYNETILFSTLAYSIDKYKIFNLGINIKGLNRKFTLSDEFESDPVFSQGNNKWNITGDAGILFRPNDTISIGASMLNIIEPNIAFGDNIVEKLPFIINSGIMLKFRNYKFLADVFYKDKDLNGETYINEKIGVEYTGNNDKYFFRGGYDIKLSSLSLGATIKYGMANFNYAFIYQINGLSGNYGSHALSVNLNFGIKSTVPGFLTGKIISVTTSSPISGATVKVYQDNKLVAKTVTDAEGKYRVLNLIEGYYDITASGKGYSDRKLEYKRVYAGEGTYNINFRLYDAPGEISGKVTELDTITGIPGAIVEVVKNDTIVARTVTRKNGEYNILNLPEGRYDVIATAKGRGKKSVNNIYVNKGDKLTDISFIFPEAALPRIAVLPFKNATAAAKRDDYGSAVADMITTALVQSKKFNVIERENIEKILKEQELWLSGIVDSGTTKKIGQITGVGFLVVGSVSKLGNYIEMDLRMLDTQTGKIILSTNGKAGSEEKLRAAINKMVKKVTAKY